MSKTRIPLMLLLVLCASLMTGCWNRRELNELAIAVAIGIDKAGNQHQVTVQVVNPSEISKKTSGVPYAPVTIYKMRGDTIAECIRKLTVESPRLMYLSHVRLLVLSEEVAREGIRHTLDYFSRDREFRPDFYVAVSRHATAETVLSLFTQLEKIPANQLYDSLKNSEKYWAPTIGIHLDELIDDLIKEGVNPVLTGISVKGDQAKGKSKENVGNIAMPTHLQFTSIGVFNKDRLIGWMNETDSKGYNYIKGNVKGTVGSLLLNENKKERVSNELIKSSTKTTGTLVGGRPHITVVIKGEGNIAEVETSKVDLSRAKPVLELEHAMNRRIEELALHCIKKAQQQFKTDIFGFGEVMRRSEPAFWQKEKARWSEYFQKLTVDVKSDIKLRRSGRVGNSFIREMEKPAPKE
ncbi:Ger(x)C family spore germination protein [Paenibacillus tyrfis]|uniref:Uncharacterized protein n=1 Tax=Paenibacillus tyrfis TaxID=1501230 RepID=A0A081P1H0_9BACL|nr:Ger(x)C family spore germination protein [Paenibacillus tyrfis]KEQ24543.1 hypothetical protein ET33_09730 [Paenibacillus tyrfis]